MKPLINVFLGTMVMSGYLFFESILFGVMLWLAWNMSVVPYFGLTYLTYVQAAGLVFVVKILLFDSNKLNQPPRMIVTKKTTPKSEPKESE